MNKIKYQKWFISKISLLLYSQPSSKPPFPSESKAWPTAVDRKSEYSESSSTDKKIITNIIIPEQDKKSQ